MAKHVGKNFQVYIYRWMEEQIEVYPYSETLFSNKKEWAIDVHDMARYQMHALNAKSYTQKTIYHIISSIWFHLHFWKR